MKIYQKIIIFVVLIIVVISTTAFFDSHEKNYWWIESYKRFDDSREVIIYRSSIGNSVFCSEVSSKRQPTEMGNNKTVSCVEIR